jgi:signal peptidase II
LSKTTRSRSVRTRRWLVLLVVAASALAADQVTKAIVRANVPLSGHGGTYGPFEIRHFRNTGLAHGLLQGQTIPIAAMTAFAIAAMLVYFARSRGSNALLPVAFGLFVGGGLGNLVDRARLGYVTDFVAADRDGAFNLADASIMAGLAFVLLGAALTALRDRGGGAEAETGSPG